MDKRIATVVKHKGLIAEANWAKAQDMLNQNHSKSYRKPKIKDKSHGGGQICRGFFTYRSALSLQRVVQRKYTSLFTVGQLLRH